jgi:hypothetical protein
MRTLQLTIVAILIFHSAADARTTTRAAEGEFTSRAMHFPNSGVTPTEIGGIVRAERGECGPDAADAAWDVTGKLLGYSCHSASANGS